MISLHSDFNPRSREGSDFAHSVSFLLQSLFQSTLPRGERRCSFPLAPAQNPISIHAPARGATEIQEAEENTDCYFNPRSREGSDRIQVQRSRHLLISIHAPARGATFYFLRLFSGNIQFQSTLPRGERQCVHYVIDPFFTISIHAPARGATSTDTG